VHRIAPLMRARRLPWRDACATLFAASVPEKYGKQTLTMFLNAFFTIRRSQPARA
jgi:hypothetical protein